MFKQSDFMVAIGNIIFEIEERCFNVSVGN
jgi:hypothetical protein